MRAFFILIASTVIIGCSQQTNHPVRVKRTLAINTLSDVIVDNLRSKKIVMVGDAYHQSGYYMRLVTEALDRWIDGLEKEKSFREQKKEDRVVAPLLEKLFLFIEADSETVGLIRRSMQTDDYSGWMMFEMQRETKWGRQPSGISVDNIEYFRNLKRIGDRVKKLNDEDPSHPYDFQVIGPEGTPPRPAWTKDTSGYREKRRRSEKEKFEWFAHQRDELSSATVRKMLDEHPGYRAMVFYGTAHLLRGRLNKAVNTGGAPQGVDTATAYGYYLASYFDQFFSRDSVSVFHTINGKGFGLPRIEELEHSPTAPDYRVYCFPMLPAPCPLEIVNCQTTLRALYELMKKNGLGKSEEEQLLSQAFASRLAHQLRRSYLLARPESQPLLESLRRHARDTNQLAMEKRNEIANTLIKSFDAIQNINLLEAWIAAPLRDSLLYLPMLNCVLKNLPRQGIPFEEEEFANASLNEDLKTKLMNRKEDLVEYFLVNLLWLGTPDEKERARDALMTKTGQNLGSARAWSDWWRNRQK